MNDRQSWLGHVGGAVVRLVTAAIVVAAVCFVAFLLRVPVEEVALTERADGIVVLTGGAARVNDAIELLAMGHGRRLLISGVNPDTRAKEIARLNPDSERIMQCCVDLDRDARNTVGNADAARRWVRERGFRSIIVVTSSYHMPRAMAELRHQLPDVALTPFPVVTERLRAEPWWSSGATMKLVLLEYLKYMYAIGRMQFEGAPDARTNVS